MNNSRLVASIIDYIEEHLQEKLTLEELAQQLNYSKFYLLHEFKETAQQPLYNYIKRRRLNEAAKCLLYSEQRIIEVAIQMGYHSQQAFSKAFEELFKLTPRRYRLQNKQFLIEEPYVISDYLIWANEQDVSIRLAEVKEQEKILYFVQLMRGALPYLNGENYLPSLQSFIKAESCYLAWAKGRVIGLLLFDSRRERIENLIVLPFCWSLKIEERLLAKLIKEKRPQALYTTTFRDADKLDIGHRQRLLELGFIPWNETVEVNYPTEKMRLSLRVMNEIHL